jgi:hypothetical protein
LQIFIYHSYKEVESFWDKQLPQQHCLCLHQIQIIEQSAVPFIKPLYIIVKENNETMMQCFGQLLTFSPSFISMKNAIGPFRSIVKTSLNMMKLQLLTIGHLFRHDGVHIHFSEHVKDNQYYFSSFIDALQKKVKCHAVFLKDLPSALSLPFKVNRAYTAFDNDVSMQMQIPLAWQSFGDYEKALTKKYAKRLRTTQKSFASVEIKELTLKEIIAQKKEIFELYLQVVNHQSITFGKLNEDYFPEFKKALGEELLVYGFYYEGKMIAFSSAILQHGHYDMNYIGFDYGLNQQLAIYFNMLFFFVKDAIERKCNALILGRTALEAKAILGAKPVPVMGYYSVKNRFFSAITNLFTQKTAKNQGDMWLNRHPFKEDKPSGNSEE